MHEIAPPYVNIKSGRTYIVVCWNGASPKKERED